MASLAPDRPGAGPAGISLQIHPPGDMGTFDGRGTPAEAARAAHLMHVMHDRHVPLTPDLALALAQLETSEQPAENARWGGAFECAASSFGMAARAGRNRFWARARAEFPHVIAAPLLRRIAADLGFVRLIGPAEFPVLGRAASASRYAEYQQYCAAVEHRLAQLLADPSLMGERFWMGVAVQLYANAARAAARPDRPGAQPSPTLPFELDMTLCHTVFQIEPVFDNMAALRRALPKANIRSQRERMGTRPKEGGIKGILHSHRLEEFSDALASEFAYPKDLMVMRMLDEGFLVKNRPPMRKPPHDLLLLTMAEGDTGSRSACLVKSAWADAALRLRIILDQMDQRNSDLGWCDFHAAGPRAAALNARLGLSELRPDPFDLCAAQRHQQMLTSSLLPTLFSLLPAQKSPLGPAERPAMLDQASAAILAAIAQNRRPAPGETMAQALHAAPQPRPDRHPPALGSYSRILSLSICPLAGEYPDGNPLDWADIRVGIAKQLNLSRAARSGVAMLLYPPVLAPGARFYGYHGAHDTPKVITIPDADDPDAIAKTIGALSAWIILRVLEVADAR